MAERPLRVRTTHAVLDDNRGDLIPHRITKGFHGVTGGLVKEVQRRTGAETTRKGIGMHVELSRTYPVARHEGFAYFMDVGSWTEWTTLDVSNPEVAVWEQPGDVIRYARKSSLPGFPMRGEAVLDEVTPDELVRMTMTTAGLPEMPVECQFTHAGPGAFTITLSVDTEHPPGFFGEALQRLLFVETLTARDMRSCLDGLERTLPQTRVQ